MAHSTTNLVLRHRILEEALRKSVDLVEPQPMACRVCFEVQDTTNPHACLCGRGDWTNLGAVVLELWSLIEGDDSMEDGTIHRESNV